MFGVPAVSGFFIIADKTNEAKLENPFRELDNFERIQFVKILIDELYNLYDCLKT